MKASRLPCHGPKATGDFGSTRLRLTLIAATLSVPSKLAQPLIADPGWLIGRAQSTGGGEPHGSQRSPHGKSPPVMKTRLIVPRRAATASNGRIAEHSSAVGPALPRNSTRSAMQVTRKLGAGEAVDEGDRKGVAMSVDGGATPCAKDGIGAAHPTARTQSQAIANIFDINETMNGPCCLRKGPSLRGLPTKQAPGRCAELTRRYVARAIPGRASRRSAMASRSDSGSGSTTSRSATPTRATTCRSEPVTAWRSAFATP
jgi:hypothetical protein